MGISHAAEEIGFRTMAVKVPFSTADSSASLEQAPLPCIAHWNQNHFVVVYKVSSKYVWIADPGSGRHRLSRSEFKARWLGQAEKGILLLLEPPEAASSRGTSAIDRQYDVVWFVLPGRSD